MTTTDPTVLVGRLWQLIDDEQLLEAARVLALIEAHPRREEVEGQLRLREPRLDQLRREESELLAAKAEFEEAQGWEMVATSHENIKTYLRKVRAGLRAIVCGELY